MLICVAFKNIQNMIELLTDALALGGLERRKWVVDGFLDTTIGEWEYRYERLDMNKQWRDDINIHSKVGGTYIVYRALDDWVMNGRALGSRA